MAWWDIYIGHALAHFTSSRFLTYSTANCKCHYSHSKRINAHPPAVYHIFVGMVASQQCYKGGVGNQLSGSEHKIRNVKFYSTGRFMKFYTCEYLPLEGSRKLAT